MPQGCCCGGSALEAMFGQTEAKAEEGPCQESGEDQMTMA